MDLIREQQRGLTRSLHSLSSQNSETLLLLILLTQLGVVQVSFLLSATRLSQGYFLNCCDSSTYQRCLRPFGRRLRRVGGKP
jgi:hypothetical protein